MKLIMATEAQRLIGISLAKIAQSRCVRGGVSLHKNLLVATVLQKARYLFMEEAFHMVHGHYINQQNSKLIEQQQQLLLQHHHQKLQQLHQQQLQQQQELENRKSDDESEFDKLFAPVTIRREYISREQQDRDDDELDFLTSDDSNSSNESNEEVNIVISNKENNPPVKSELTYLDLDITTSSKRSNTSNGSLKRRIDSSEWDSDDTILSIIPKTKQFKVCTDTCCEDNVTEAEDLSLNDHSVDNSLGVDFLSTSKPSCNNNYNTSNNNIKSSNNNHTPSTTVVTPLDNTNTNSSSATTTTTSSIENIDRITSLVSIFNFGNLQRSVSTPDLCSSQANCKNNKDTVIDNNCCNLTTQRQYLAMTV